MEIKEMFFSPKKISNMKTRIFDALNKHRKWQMMKVIGRERSKNNNQNKETLTSTNAAGIKLKA